MRSGCWRLRDVLEGPHASGCYGVLAEQTWYISAQCGAGLLDVPSKCHLNLVVS